jgi:hypothetical protein
MAPVTGRPCALGGASCPSPDENGFSLEARIITGTNVAINGRQHMV